MTGIIDAIDQAIRCQRDGCTKPINNSVSDDFCSQDCQAAWHAQRSEPLVDYQEPYDLLVHALHAPAFMPSVQRSWPVRSPASPGPVYYDSSPETALVRRVQNGYQEFLNHLGSNFHRTTILVATQQVAEEIIAREPRYLQHADEALERNLHDQAKQQNLMIIAQEPPRLLPRRGPWEWTRTRAMIAAGIPGFAWPTAAPGGYW